MKTERIPSQRDLSLDRPSPHGHAIAWVLTVLALTGAYYTFVALGADRDIWQQAGGAFGIQMASFALASLLLGWGRHWNSPRPSDPGMIFLLWASCYLIYPSGYWIRGGPLLFDEYLSSAGRVILQGHAVFLVAFMVMFLAVSGRKYWTPPEIDTRNLPNAGLLLSIPIGVLIVVAGLRWATTGTVVASHNYGDTVFAIGSQIQSARAGGGLDYFIVQVLLRVSFFPFLALGIGGGIVGAKALKARKGRTAWIFLLFGISVLCLVLGVATRSGALMVILIAVFLTDMLTGLVRWRFFLPVLLVILSVFVFFQFFREINQEGLGTAVKHSASQVGLSNNGQLNEFTFMLSKEAVGERYFAQRPDGPVMVVRDALSLIPSQLMPSKLASTWAETGDVLAINMIGASQFAKGGGVGGAVLADGFRIGGGPWGVCLIAVIFASILGAFVRWMTALPEKGPQLLRVALSAGYLAWIFLFIRGDLQIVLSVTLYNLVVPWLILKFALDEYAAARWLRPMPSAAKGRSIESSPHTV